MSSFKLILMNCKHNMKTYSIYFFSMIFSIAVFYNFAVLQCNPEAIASTQKCGVLQGVSYTTAFIFVVFIAAYLEHGNKFFLNNRKKEIGIYAFMGISQERIARIFVIESILLAFAALCAGVGIGILFNKFFLMFIAKFALLDTKIPFFISWASILRTFCVFGILFLCFAFYSYITIVRSRLIDLFKGAKKEEKIKKPRLFKGIIGVLCIVAGYAFILNASLLMLFVAILITVPLVVLGTFLMFDFCSVAMIKKITQNKRILYKGANIITLSNIAYKIKKNYKTYALVAVFVACSITAFGTVYSFRYYILKNYHMDVPYSISYISEDETLENKLSEIVEKYDRKITRQVGIKYLELENERENVVSFEEIKKNAESLNLEALGFSMEDIEPADGEMIYIPQVETFLAMTDGKRSFLNKEFNMRQIQNMPLFGLGMSQASYIVSPQDYKYMKSKGTQKTFQGYSINWEQDKAEISLEIYENFPKDINLFSSYYAHAEKYDLMGIVFAFGSIMAIVFIVATGSIIYFKCISDGFNDCGKYSILSKLGIEDTEILGAIKKEIAIAFILPFAVGTIHAAVALIKLGGILETNLLLPATISMIAFIIIYFIFYVLTIHKYEAMIESVVV